MKVAKRCFFSTALISTLFLLEAFLPCPYNYSDTENPSDISVKLGHLIING